MPAKISIAWEALRAAPRYTRSWSAWAQDGSCLYVTLPAPDIEWDGRTIPLWNIGWTTASGSINPLNTEQETNVRNAIVGKKPMLGFRADMNRNGEHIKAAHYERLLPLRIIKNTTWEIVAQTDEAICL
jgi:hypothetical protein